MRTLAGSTPDTRLATRAVRTRAWQRLRWLGGTALAVAVLMFCYLRIAGTTPVVSDGAGNALEAWDMLHGDVLLHGWRATDVSFWTTQLPVLSLIEAAAGLRIEVVHIGAAATYALLLLLAAYVAKGRATGAEALGRVLLAALIMLAPETGAPAYVLLGSPDHLGAAGLPALLVLLLLDRAPRAWWVPVATCALLIWGLLGDQLVLLVGVAPVIVVCLARAWLALHRSQASLRELRFELSLVVAAVCAVVAARCALLITAAVGGLQVGQLSALSPLGLLHAPSLSIRNVVSILGADPGGSPYLFESGPGGVPQHVRGGLEIAFAFAHLAGVALVITAVVMAARRLIRSLRHPTGGQPDLVTDLMVTAIVVNVVTFLCFFEVYGLYLAEEVGPVLPLGAALAGRQLGGPLIRAVLTSTGRAGIAVRLSAMSVAVCYCAMLGYAAAQPQVPPGNAALANWLLAHNLHSGLGENWQASSVMLDTGGKVTLGSVIDSENGRISRHQWQADLSLMNPATHYANFLIIPPGRPRALGEALRTFGAPATTYHYKSYTILIWHKNLLQQLGPPVPLLCRPQPNASRISHQRELPATHRGVPLARDEGSFTAPAAAARVPMCVGTSDYRLFLHT